MALASRVAPDGSLVATPARGLFMGNRGGRIHDPVSRQPRGRPWTSKAWICCLLAFKGRTPPDRVWGSARYTELFFCDEVTALAAGHRPCVECRRADAHAWRAAAWAGAGGGRDLPLFPQVDAVLHDERLDGRAKLTHPLPAEGLPDGAMVRSEDGVFLALRGTAALPWRPEGYGPPQARPRGVVAVLTPPLSLAGLANGYRPAWHPSAG